MRNRAALRRRIDAIETAVNERWTAHAMSVLGGTMAGQPAQVRAAIAAHLRQLVAQRRLSQSADPVASILAAVREVAPDIAATVASRLNIDLQETSQ